MALAGALSLAACGGGGETIGIVGSVKGFLGGAVTDEPRAALVARDILSAGGTAADAAVALYFTLAVTYPSAASLGGGGVCVVNDPKLGRSEALDFIARAPAAPGIAATPANARGMYALYAKYGKLRWEQLLSTSETLARFGTPVSRALAVELAAAWPALSRDPAARALFGRADGTPLGEGDLLVQRDLATLLAHLRSRGPGDLYIGPLGRRFIAAAQDVGASLSFEDMRDTLPAWRPTVPVNVGDVRLHFASPPAVAGLVEAEILGAVAPRWRRAPAEERPHLLAEAMLRVARDRQRWQAPDLTVNASIIELVGERHLAGLMADYRADRRSPADGLQAGSAAPPDAPATTGFVVADREGMAVACTVTAYERFGLGRLVPGMGVLLAAAPDNAARTPAFLGPVIGLRDRTDVVFAAAAGSGPAAMGALAGVALATLVDERRLEAALDAPRFYYPGPGGALLVEAGAATRLPGLGALGYTVTETPPLGRVNAVFCPDGLLSRSNTCQFFPDRRGFGLAGFGG
ncbi:MAG: gamma-glutamyltransferase [Rhodospirillales bacterium]|nr:gamma-glutamyltransferase [Rhodospirillales bacterium]